jgi:hypothetical protein
MFTARLVFDEIGSPPTTLNAGSNFALSPAATQSFHLEYMSETLTVALDGKVIFFATPSNVYVATTLVYHGLL